MSKIIGLIGGIGSGKSEVAQLLEEAGAIIIDADKIAHEALRDPTNRELIVQRWGNQLLDEQGQIQRRALGAIVFADEQQRKALESIVHPWIGQHIKQELTVIQAEDRAPLIVLDAAIMLEAGWHEVCDELIYIDVPRELRLQRVQSQRNWTESDLDAREQAQWPLDQKRARADHVIDNSQSRDDLLRQINSLLAHWGIGTSK